jgi:hypothetical protein
VYPYFDLYPAPAASVDQETERITPVKVTLDKYYPSLEICRYYHSGDEPLSFNHSSVDASVYPHNLVIYPEVRQLKHNFVPIVVSSSQYPTFDLCAFSEAEEISGILT